MNDDQISGMVNITDKPPVLRVATATGLIRLKGSTIEAIRSGQIKKGDALTTARIAAILAVKDTPRIIPMCHPITVTGIDVDFLIEHELVKTTVTVTSVGKTGVEMEALTGVAAALLNIWDMVKYLEKDETGNYLETEIKEIKVLEKRKGPEGY
ncbi:MAG: cyclic pyranopterin monophosphate synthase MoaC [Methanotrichaceae archaeon]